MDPYRHMPVSECADACLLACVRVRLSGCMPQGGGGGLAGPDGSDEAKGVCLSERASERSGIGVVWWYIGMVGR